MNNYKRVDLLDHGYIELIEPWGRGKDGRMEAAIIEGARQSTGKGFYGWEAGACPVCNGTGYVLETAIDLETTCGVCAGKGNLSGDMKLLTYLYENWHHTPFEMAGITIEVQAPIAVFREWHRHRTQSFSEFSGRYTKIPDMSYVPSVERCMLAGQAGNKQAGKAQGANDLTETEASYWLTELEAAYDHCEEVYQRGLKIGIPKELARLPVNVGRYSRMRASGNLRNWLHFLTLRMDPAAQWEIRQYANEIAKIVEQVFPRTYSLFNHERERPNRVNDLLNKIRDYAPYLDTAGNVMSPNFEALLDKLEAEVL